MKAELMIQTALRNKVTYLKSVYYTTPFKIANITEDKTAGTLHLMWMSSSPGILDGDDYTVRIDMEKSTSLQLHTQSFQRLFEMQKGASQTMEVHMNEGCTFTYLPHPAVPHYASSFTSRNKLFLSNECEVTWGEILTCGRKLSGESFAYSKYHNITEVYLNQRLVIKENLLIQPASINPNALGQLEGYTHQASLLYLANETHVRLMITKVHEMLSLVKGVSFGVSLLPVSGLVVRILGSKGEQLYDLLKQVAKLLHQNRVSKHEPFHLSNTAVHAS